MGGGSTYQVVILGAGAEQHAEQLRRAVLDRVAELGHEVLEAVLFVGHDDLATISDTGPVVVVYIGGDTATDSDEAVAFLTAGTPVVPVVPGLGAFADLLPPALIRINSYRIDWDDADLAELVTTVLENLKLLRRDRRLFISYHRNESRIVAHQFRVAFDDAGYDPFLDTSTLRKGDDFQAVIWHRILDSDVVVVMDTPDFLLSRWTREEIAQAEAASVGILRVVWPGVESHPAAALARQVALSPEDFDHDALTDAAIQRVVIATESFRARCLAARHINLVGEFCREARAIGLEPIVQPGGYVVATLSDGRRVAALPAVGVPGADRYHEASRRFPAGGEHADLAVLLYDHRGILPEWATFLDWLDDYLPVKGLRVTQTASQLAGT